MSDLPLFDPFKALEEARREAPKELSQKLSQPVAKVNPEQDQELSSTFAASAAFAAPSNGPEDFRSLSIKERKRFSPLFSITYARPERLVNEPSEHEPTTPAKAAKPAKETLNHSYHSAFTENPSAKVTGLLLRKWQIGLASLSPDRVPCRGLPPAAWAEVYGNALAFLDTFGAQAEALGWKTHELFGVHPSLGTTRVDYAGALLLTAGGLVRAITADTIRFERTTYRRALGQPHGIPVWECAR